MTTNAHRSMMARLLVLSLLGALLALAVPAAAMPEGPIRLISANTAGTSAGNDQSQSLQSISDDGRYVVFTSRATDLVTGLTDANGANLGDVYVRNTTTGATTLVSHAAGAPTTTASGGSSGNGRISANGAYIVYDTFATNLGTGVTDSNAERDVYVYTVATGTNTLVSHIHNNTSATCTIPNGAAGGSLSADISDDGAYIAYQSVCNDLQDNLAGTGTVSNIWRYNRATNAAEVLSRPNAFNPNSITTGNNNSVSPDISGQGNVVVYTTGATNITGDDTNNASDIGYWRAPVGNQNSLSIILSFGPTETGNGNSGNATVSDDGVYVAFQTAATDIGPGNDTNGNEDIILATLPVGQAATYVDVSANAAGTDSGNGPSFKPRIAGGGGAVAFVSNATNITDVAPSKSSNAVSDVFVYSRGTDSVRLASVNVAGNNGGNGNSGQPGNAPGLQISDDGTQLVYTSLATDLSNLDDQVNQDIYTTDTTTGGQGVRLLSVNVAGNGEGNNDSRNASVSSNGLYVTFQSEATDLTALTDANGDPDIFAILGQVTPTININDVQMNEGNTGTTTFGFTVSLGATPTGTVTVGYATVNGTAVGGTGPGDGIDYMTRSGTLTFAAGETSKTVNVTVYGDTLPEPDETFTVQLSNPTGGYTLADGTGLGTISDDDSGPIIAITDTESEEGNTGTSTLSFPVSLGMTPTGPVTVDYATVNGTATGGPGPADGIDYMTRSGTLTFAAGETAKTVDVTVYGDTNLEPDETFTVQLSNPTGGYTLATGMGTATGSILDDDNVVETADLRDGVNDTLRVVVDGGPGNNAPSDVALRYSKALFPDAPMGSREALLATDGGFADALAAGGPQGNTVANGRPLLLTATDQLYPSVLEELRRLGVSTVRILGGTAAISQSVQDELVTQGFTVIRASGPSRLETATDTARQIFPTATTAILVRAFPAQGGEDTQAFADSVGAGAWAAEQGWPLLFTQTEVLSDSTAAYLQQSSIQTVYVVGGTAAINDSVLDSVRAQGKTVIRTSGPSRFDTALAIAAARGYTSESDASQVMVLDGTASDAWVAGFTGAAYSAIKGAPIVLGVADQIPPATAAFLQPPATFAVDQDNVSGYVLVCGIAPVRCEESRQQLGLPSLAEVAEPSGSYEQGTQVPFQFSGTFSAASHETLIECAGQQSLGSGGSVSASGSSTSPVLIDVPSDYPAGPCLVKVKLIYSNGSEQTAVADITVTTASGASQ